MKSETPYAINDIEGYALAVGCVVVNLQSLELILRLFLTRANKQAESLPKAAGEEVDITFMTNWDTLGRLIEKYNNQLAANEPHFRVSRDTVAIRDALAHGRLLPQDPEFSTTFVVSMFKFHEPKNGKTLVKSVNRLDAQWLGAKKTFVRDQAYLVTQCSNSRGYNTFRGFGS